MIGGLPEKYGLDLGTVRFAAGCRCQMVVVDHRPQALAALEALSGEIKSRPKIELRPAASLAQPLDEQALIFDLWVSTSAIQMLDSAGVLSYLDHVRRHARCAVLFAPNKDNGAHLTISGLDGFHLSQLVTLCARARLRVLESGYLDLPPFPPGIKRSEEAKAKASTSLLARGGMVALEWWGRLERYFPRGLRRRYGHLVYAILRPEGS